MGAFSEASEDLHNLLHTLAASRVACSDLVIGQLRKRLSTAAIWATKSCLMARLGLIGEGSWQANQRRAFKEREERLMQREGLAQWHRRVRAHGVTHRGELYLR